MLLCAKNPSQIDCHQLMAVYSQEQEMSFFDDLSDFFSQKKAFYCIWQDGDYVSALRLEPYGDGLLLSGLETKPDCRSRGYAKLLLKAVLSLEEVKSWGKVYSHIHKRNIISQKLHKKMHFEKISDTAVLLDGTVSAFYETYRISL